MPNAQYIFLIGGVIVFDLLVVWWFFFRRPQRAARFGLVEVPGEEIVELPEGEAKLTYRIFIDRTGESVRRLEVPDGLRVTAESAEGGEPASVQEVSSRTQYRSLRRRTVQTHFANLRVPTAGRYSVNAVGVAAGSEDPTVLIG